uniref:Uncharacterized protein n=1 Tax=Chromera velia CCMP2878 TaxID=1169474 RepID=A0A0G4I7I7_9ALVE|eukprot:Cvel_36526.t1-p1 / transcript=Cvel_36526.t1 / gene=Cvel_36526 / organism=Chromera_velia_CCMP2878 / gene_product=hypothetical protein / transcript_product=hypothetical protein / location=Cvel_scaffold7388:866-1585(+) / protein_length=240 / sequence_SO=supercontig / SO=protein_coding / is_pseudo=false
MANRHPSPAQKSLGPEIVQLREENNIKVPAVALQSLRQETQERYVAFCHVATQRQLADPLTKPKGRHELYDLLDEENFAAREAATRPIPNLRLRPLLQDENLQAETDVFFQNVDHMKKQLRRVFKGERFILPDRKKRDSCLVPSNALAIRGVNLSLICASCRCIGHKSTDCPDEMAKRKGTFERNCQVAKTSDRFCTWCEGVGMERPGHRTCDHVKEQTKPTIPHAPITLITQSFDPILI